MALNKKEFKKVLADEVVQQLESSHGMDFIFSRFPVSNVETFRPEDRMIRLRVQEDGVSGPHYFDIIVKESY